MKHKLFVLLKAWMLNISASSLKVSLYYYLNILFYLFKSYNRWCLSVCKNMLYLENIFLKIKGYQYTIVFRLQQILAICELQIRGFKYLQGRAEPGSRQRANARDVEGGGVSIFSPRNSCSSCSGGGGQSPGAAGEHWGWGGRWWWYLLLFRRQRQLWQHSEQLLRQSGVKGLVSRHCRGVLWTVGGGSRERLWGLTGGPVSICNFAIHGDLRNVSPANGEGLLYWKLNAILSDVLSAWRPVLTQSHLKARFAEIKIPW